MLGYISEVNSFQIEQSDGKYKSGDYIGASGLEFQYEENLRGEKGRELILKDNRTLFYKKAANFTNIKNITITVEDSIPAVLQIGDTLNLTMSLHNPNDYAIDMRLIKLAWSLGKNREARIWKINKKLVQFPEKLAANASAGFEVSFIVPKHKGEWLLNWSLRNKGLPMVHNGEFQKVKIVK